MAIGKLIRMYTLRYPPHPISYTAPLNMNVYFTYEYNMNIKIKMSNISRMHGELNGRKNPDLSFAFFFLYFFPFPRKNQYSDD